MPEGTAVFAGEPLLEVTAPIAEAQLAETVLLNHITSQTSVATKAARCVLAAGGAQLVDFAFRRTQGIGAGLAVARASAIAGFTATSNVEAARCYGLTAAGTMAHSFIEAFGDEYAAFAAFAEDFPGKTTFLVDTYDTEQGVRTAIDVADRLRLPARSGSASTPVTSPGRPAWPAACSTAPTCARRGFSSAAAWTDTRSPIWWSVVPRSTPTASAPRAASGPHLPGRVIAIKLGGGRGGAPPATAEPGRVGTFGPGSYGRGSCTIGCMRVSAGFWEGHGAG